MDLEPWSVDQFNSEVWLMSKSQSGPSRYLPHVMTGNHTGAEHVAPVNFMGDFDFADAPPKGTPKTHVDVEKERRWCKGKDKTVNILLHQQDEVRTIVQARGPLQQEGVNASGRLYDNIIRHEFRNTAVTGEKYGDDSEVWDTSGEIAHTEGGSTKMNTRKIELIIKLFKQRKVPYTSMGGIKLAITAEDNDYLIREVEIASNQYTKKVEWNDDGTIKSYMGVQFIHDEDLDTDLLTNDGTYRYCPAWVQRAMHMGVWVPPQFAFSVREDLSFDPTQMSGKAIIGATRLRAKWVGCIKVAV